MRLIFLLLFASIFFYVFPAFPCDKCDQIEGYLKVNINNLSQVLYEDEVGDSYSGSHLPLTLKLMVYWDLQQKFYK